MMAVPLIGAFLVAVLGVWLAARTSFGRPPWNPGPLWIHVYLEVPVFILPAVVLAPIDGIRELWLFADVPDSTLYLGIWLIYYALIGYFLSLFAVDRLIVALVGPYRAAQHPRSNTEVLMCVLLLGQVTVLVILMITLKQVPLFSLLSGGDDVGELRKEATIEFAGPAAVLSMARLYGFLGFLLAAARNSSGPGRGLSAAVMAGSALCLTWSGEKSPLVMGLLAYWFLSRWQKGGQVNLRQTVLDRKSVV